METETISIGCECGQETEFVRIDNGYRFAERHGKGDEKTGLVCFNCHKELAEAEAKTKKKK